MDGTLLGCDAWFTNPASGVSSHFGIGLRGQQHQYVALNDSSWANGVLEPGNNWQNMLGYSSNPNFQTITVETEDRGDASQPVTDDQYDATLAVCRHSLRQYPSIRWLLRHTDISPRTRPNCPGDRWIRSGRFQALAEELGLKITF
jgi:N-acetyl-anhydromuramyl-L-alanine amidase AmpD